MLRAGCIILFAIAVWSTPSIACELFADEARYRIEHEIFGTIGEERLSSRRFMEVLANQKGGVRRQLYRE